jgi:cysteine synthase
MKTNIVSWEELRLKSIRNTTVDNPYKIIDYLRSGNADPSVKLKIAIALIERQHDTLKRLQEKANILSADKTSGNTPQGLLQKFLDKILVGENHGRT